MNNFVINKLWTLCIKYRNALIHEDVWQLDTLLWVVWNSIHKNVDATINTTSDFVREDMPADNVDIETLLEELRIVYNRLEEIGVTKELARQMLWEREKISRIYVRKNGSITLADYGVEIVLPPLQWCLYVLFLRHPDGIAYKKLPDYKDELNDMLIDIYKRNDGQVNESRLSHIVDRLTDSTCGSINENVSKIRRAFINAIGSEDCARHYYIQGTRGGVRRISIDRAFVVIE